MLDGAPTTIVLILRNESATGPGLALPQVPARQKMVSQKEILLSVSNANPSWFRWKSRSERPDRKIIAQGETLTEMGGIATLSQSLAGGEEA
ncbi:hypothetical protein [Sphingobium olei]|uniref:Uncharacterized protein n=1 Tax=Sphingobium olei TaxID=420955 RepID=A0ABW3P5S6_9SPHN|nr:hypothetical protein [Sphingobium sp.]